MNLNPNNPTPGTDDETIDESLLNEALAEATPEELEAKILALTDPPMMSLLDEALAPEPASDELTQRILAATSPAQQDAPSVLARIGPATFRYAAAAAIVLAVGIGVYFVNQEPVDTGNSIAKAPDASIVVEDDIDSSVDDPDWLTQEQYASSADYFDAETELIEDALNSVADSLDDATITRDTLWAELDAYEQFIDDIES